MPNLNQLPRYRHLKRGTTYRVLGKGTVLSDCPLIDMEEVCIFRELLVDDILVCSAKGMGNYRSDLILIGKAQTSTYLKYGDIVIVYELEKDESLWVRSVTEFENRFEKIN